MGQREGDQIAGGGREAGGRSLRQWKIWSLARCLRKRNGVGRDCRRGGREEVLAPAALLCPPVELPLVLSLISLVVRN